MALFRKFFYRKPPDGLVEISERVYVFDSCFTTDVWEEADYRVYVGGIMGQLRDLYAVASFMLFNFREGEKQSQIANILSDYDVTVMDYPRHYEGCPLLTMEMMHHFLRSSDNWLSLGQQNVLFMHCERGGWPVLAFMLAALLIYRKQFNGELKMLNMIYNQAPHELLQLMSPLNPIPSQLRYLQYVSRRNLGSEWPPLDRGLTLDCIILRFIPIMDGEGGCRPIFRIYGQNPFMGADRTPKVLFSTPRRSKLVRHFKQADCELVKIDIHCHIQGDVVLECITLDNDMEREEMMFRIMFNTAFIRSNILILNRDDIDMLWNIKDQFPKDFRAEVIFSEMGAAASLNLIDLPHIEEKEGLPMEAFAKVQEIFSGMDWLDTKTETLNVLQQITISNTLQGKLDEEFSQNAADCLLLESAPDKLTFEEIESENNIQHSKSNSQESHSTQSIESPEDENFVNKIQSHQLQDATLLSRKIESQKVQDVVPVRMETEYQELQDTSSVGRKIQPQEPHCRNSTKEKIEPQAKHDGSLTKKETEPQELHISLQWPAQSKIISQRIPQTTLFLPTSPSNSLQGSPISLSRFQSLPTALGITALLHDHSVSNGEEELKYHPVTASPPSKAISLPNLNSHKSVQPNNLKIPMPPPLPLWPSLPQSLGDSSMIESTSCPSYALLPQSPSQPAGEGTNSSLMHHAEIKVLGRHHSASTNPPPPPPISTSISSPLQGSYQFPSSPLSFLMSSSSSLAKNVILAPPPSYSPTFRPLPSTINNSISTSFPTTPTQAFQETSSSFNTKDVVLAPVPLSSKDEVLAPPPPPPPHHHHPRVMLGTTKTLYSFSSPSASLSSPHSPPPIPFIYGGSNSSLCMKNSKFSFAPSPPPPLPKHLRPTSNSTKVSFVSPPPPFPTHFMPPLPPPPPPPTHPKAPYNSSIISFVAVQPPPTHPKSPSKSTPTSSLPPPPLPPFPPLPSPPTPLRPPSNSTTISSMLPPPCPLPLPTSSNPPNSTTLSSALPPSPFPAPLRSPSNSTTISFVSPPPPPPPPPYSRPPSNSTTISSMPPVPPPPPASSSDHLCSKFANAPPVPPPPQISGAPKVDSASSHSHCEVGNGNVPPVPGPPGVAPGNGRGISRVGPRIHGQAKKSNLKPYHWLKLTRAMQGSLWAEAQKSDDASKAPEFDMSELESLFSASSPNSDSTGGKSNRRTSGPKPEKIQLIELRRAYNCEIMLSKVKIPLPDLLSSVLTLDESALDIDQVENLIKFSPTKEEMELLKNYKGDMEKLGKCEQFFLELMKVPRVESKLRVFAFKIQFDSQVSDLRKNLNLVNSVAEEIRNSAKLKRIMQTILSLGNALNQGTARGSAIGFRLDSLLKLTDTRARNNKMTLMHYLCKVLAEKVPELLDFPKDLVSLEPSTKIQLKSLAEEMQAISKGLEKVLQELTASGNDGAFSEIFCKTLKEFLSHAEAEVRSLASLYSCVGRNADALALYFGEDPARCPFEQVVSTLQNFVRMYVRALEENCKQLEFEKKRAQKEAEMEKRKLDPSKKDSENLIHPPVKSHDIK